LVEKLVSRVGFPVDEFQNAQLALSRLNLTALGGHIG
jgi:hypothetical protein